MDALLSNSQIITGAIVTGIVFILLIAQLAINKYMRKQSERALKLNKEYVQVMISQIQPHFLYNTLTAIAMKCEDDPEEAEEMVLMFSKYLRGNLDSIDSSEAIEFSHELEHVKTYVALEKKRFGDKINVNMDIKATDFKIPPLGLQTIVENSIRHGVCEKETNGNICISTREDNNNYIIEVSDDGVGFDVDKLKQASKDGKLHIGIPVIKDRIKEICNGSVEVESKIGEGSRVTIIIPKERK